MHYGDNNEHDARKDPEPYTQPRLMLGWDALVLVLLVFALLQISGFAEATLGNRLQDVMRHPLLGKFLPPAGIAAMGDLGPRPGEPLGLLLHASTIGLLILYLLLDLGLHGRKQIAAKWIVLAAIIITAVLLPTCKLILLDAQGPRGSYSHDGGVIQTEATITFFVEGKNPYIEDYTNTPMANWGHPAFRTALYHYPYLPWTFLFSTPFYLLGQALGFYDQRLVYWLLMGIALIVAPQLLDNQRGRLTLVAGLALNPIMALDLMFGQNDAFVLCWIILSLVCWRRWCKELGQRKQLVGLLFSPGAWSLLFFGLACASKPTAWFFAPFYGLLLVAHDPARAFGAGSRTFLRTWGNLISAVPTILRRAWLALAVCGVILVPYIVWDANAFYDDVWRWSNGQGESGYQIWGWGASNFVLAMGLVADRFGQWPFWRLELILALPILLWFLYRQQRANTLANACWHYALFLLVFFYASRFLNENYLGYILAFLFIGALCHWDEIEKEEAAPMPSFNKSERNYP